VRKPGPGVGLVPSHLFPSAGDAPGPAFTRPGARAVSAPGPGPPPRRRLRSFPTTPMAIARARRPMSTILGHTLSSSQPFSLFVPSSYRPTLRKRCDLSVRTARQSAISLRALRGLGSRNTVSVRVRVREYRSTALCAEPRPALLRWACALALRSRRGRHCDGTLNAAWTPPRRRMTGAPYPSGGARLDHTEARSLASLSVAALLVAQAPRSPNVLRTLSISVPSQYLDLPAVCVCPSAPASLSDIHRPSVASLETGTQERQGRPSLLKPKPARPLRDVASPARTPISKRLEPCPQLPLGSAVLITCTSAERLGSVSP
jgi:hypothetical protein